MPCPLLGDLEGVDVGVDVGRDVVGVGVDVGRDVVGVGVDVGREVVDVGELEELDEREVLEELDDVLEELLDVLEELEELDDVLEERLDVELVDVGSGSAVVVGSDVGSGSSVWVIGGGASVGPSVCGRHSTLPGGGRSATSSPSRAPIM